MSGAEYQKKTQREHILLRPDTYVGSNEVAQLFTWLYDLKTASMVFEETSYIPAMLKIFDEILVNAADNKQRDPEGTKNIKVTIDAEKGEISIYNDGKGIPVEMHATEGIYVPELIFGHLLTGSNFDDTKERTTGGRNGMGANLTSIFSTYFKIQLSDGVHLYDQVWTNNMVVCNKPKIRKDSKKKSFTKVTFRPDFSHFKGIEGMGDGDMMRILERRVRDVAGTMPKTMKVYLNGDMVKVRGFKAYTKSFGESVTLMDSLDGKWSIGLSTSPDGDGFQQVSFVNHIATLLGGTHVQYLTTRLVRMITKVAGKKRSIAARNLKAHHIRNNLRLFVSCLVVNPKFSSQSKESLTSRSDTFFPVDIPESFVESFLRTSDLMDRLEDLNDKADAKSLCKTDGAKTTRVKGIPKLEDANWAGTKRSGQCTLILTEGDSAKALAVSGLAVVGRDKYGVFPLKGKLLNVRGASSKVIEKNEEVKALKIILGLKQGCDYASEADVKRLRYGHVMVMADQDPDGSHIKGLVINFFECFWPNLLKVDGFLQQFATPIVVCTHPTNKKKQSFFTLSDYRRFKNGEGMRWKAKYYKGLGTSTAAEGKSYFRDLPRHVTDFTYEERCADSIEMAFGSDPSRRKEFVSRVVHEPDEYDPMVRTVSCHDFVQKELIVYSSLSVNRAIPSMVDGLKPGQRKIMFVCFKRGVWKEIKVAQLAGSVSELSAYHHGEESLCGTIVGLAQNFVGSNNENLLVPSGQFGTRNKGTKEAASPRYIFTALAPCVKKLFRAEDAGILEHLEDDGMMVEPKHYYPLLPLVLINGACGIGTGYSTSVPCHTVRDVYDSVISVLNGKTRALTPGYHGFKGTIEETSPGCYENRGVWSWSPDGKTLTVTELPIGLWTNTYKLRLCNLEEEDLIIFLNKSDDVKVYFEIVLKPGTNMDDTRKKLVSPLSGTMHTTNMNLYDETGALRHYDTAWDVLVDFVRVRLDAYKRRAEHLVETLTADVESMTMRSKFLEDVLSGDLVVARRPVADILSDMKIRGYDESFLSMSIRSMTADKLEELRKDIETTRATIKYYQTVTPKQLYLTELREMTTTGTKNTRKEEVVEEPPVKRRRLTIM